MMRIKLHLSFIGLFLVALALGFSSSGCDEGEVFRILDIDEIKRYIEEAPDEPDLFRVDGLIANTPYYLPFDSTEYRDFVDSVTRTFVVNVAGPFDFGYLGYIQEALATVTDCFYVRTQKVLGLDTTELFSERDVTRYGYFLQLGNENNRFIGWKLWGFNSLGESNTPAPVRLSVKTLDGKNSLAANLGDYPHQPLGFKDFPYIKLYEIDTLKDDDTLILNVSPRNPLGYYHLVSVVGDSGFLTEAMTRIDSVHWVDTIKTPANNPRLWNIVFIQSFRNPPSGQYVRGWCIPYYVRQ